MASANGVSFPFVIDSLQAGVLELGEKRNKKNFASKPKDSKHEVRRKESADFSTLERAVYPPPV